MAFLWKALGFPTTVPNFPYTPVTEDDNKLCYCANHTYGVEWTVQRGRATEENNAEVLIFSTSLKVKPQLSSASTASFSSLSMTQINSLTPSLAQNCLQRAKSLKLPGLLRCHGGTVYNNTVYIATEFATPLHLYFKNYHSNTTTNNNTKEVNVNYENSVALGLKSITTAVASLHKNNLIHRNVNMHTVYITAGGLWKLFGFELLMSLESNTSNEVALQQSIQSYMSALRMQVREMEMNGTYSSNYVALGQQQQQQHDDESVIQIHEWPPERETNVNNSNNNCNNSARVEVSEDAWGVGCLIYEAFAYAPASIYSTSQSNNTNVSNMCGNNNSINILEEHNKLRNFTRSLPASLQVSYIHLLDANPNKRLSVVKFIDTCDFVNNNDYVHVMTSLEMLPVMSKVNREQFCDDLHHRIASFPLEACLYSILPSLTNSLQFGAVANVVEPIMVIISRLHPSSSTNISNSDNTCKEKTENELFVKLVEPSLIILYSCDDPLLRLRLLQHSKCYASQLSLSTLQNKLWPLYLKGFTHTQAMVQEATARALIHFAPLLQSTSLLVKDAIPALVSLQHHVDGAIRTNATICLCKIAQYINASNKSTLLLSGLARMLKDPFVPSRLAAIRGLYTLITLFTPTQCAMQVLPAIPALTLDKEREIREFAMKLLREITNVLERASQEQNEREVLAENKTINTTMNPSTSQLSVENRPEQISIQSNSLTPTTRPNQSMSSPLTVHQLNNFTNNSLHINVNTNSNKYSNEKMNINTSNINNNYFTGQQSINATNDSNSSYTMKTVNSASELPTPSASSSGFYSPLQGRSTNYNFNNITSNSNNNVNYVNNDNTTLSTYNNHSRSNSNMWTEEVSESSDTVLQQQQVQVQSNSIQKAFTSPLPLHLSPKHNNNNSNNNANKFTPSNQIISQNTLIHNGGNNVQLHNDDVNEENDGWSDGDDEDDDDQDVRDMKCSNINNNNNDAKQINNVNNESSVASSSQFVSTSPFTTSHSSTTFSSTVVSVSDKDNNANNQTNYCSNSGISTMKNNNNTLSNNTIISKPFTTTTTTTTSTMSTNANIKSRKKTGGLGAAKIS